MKLSEKVLNTMKAAGLDARKPANHTGECKSPYLVVQDGGEQPISKWACRRAVVIYGFVPLNMPAKLDTLMDEARVAMGTLPSLTMTGTSEETIDATFKAITANMTYTALCARG